MNDSERTEDGGDLVDLPQADHGDAEEPIDPAELSREVREGLETANDRPEQPPPPELDDDPGFPLPDG
jgi:hypothetical protein